MDGTVGTPATDLSYGLVDQWEQLPESLHHEDVVGVGVDSGDRVFILTRREARVVVCNRDGSFVTAWGEGLFTPRSHGISHGDVPEGCHTFRKFARAAGPGGK